MSYPEPIKVPTVEDLLASIRRMRPDATHAEAVELQSAIAAPANYFEKVAHVVAELPEHRRPLDQGRKPSAEERKLFQLRDDHWSLVKRWPWVAVWDEAADVCNAPWFGGMAYPGHKHAIVASLRFCLANYHSLPRLTPVHGSRIQYISVSSATDLPLMNMVSGRTHHIPRGIVKQYPMARCGEALAFVCSFTGSLKMDEIRRLVMAPSLERVAEAYAIATGYAFNLKETIVKEQAVAQFEKQEDSDQEMPLGLAVITKAHPSINESAGALAVLRVLLNKPHTLWSVPTLTEEIAELMARGQSSARMVRSYLLKLSENELAVKAGGRGTAMRWRAGPACFPSK